MNLQDQLTSTLVQFGAMVFGAQTPDLALQEVADSWGIPTVALGRFEDASRRALILAQNMRGVDVRDGWLALENAPEMHFINLSNTGSRDILILQATWSSWSSEQRDALRGITRYLAALWKARPEGFDATLDRERIANDESILHPDNPYGLTQSELRICALIADGLRPKEMTATLGISVATVRTHLRHIYTKTGLDGMIGVLHHLQVNSEAKGGAPTP